MVLRENQEEIDMLNDFILPDIGEGIVECEIVEWLVSEGQSVEEDQPIVEVMTDKAMVEIPAKHAGVVQKFYYSKGEIAKVHAPLFSLDVQDTNENLEDEVTTLEQDAMIASSDTVNTASAEENVLNKQSMQEKSESKKALASPAVRRIARENGIDLSEINGSGKKGRVLKTDLEKEFRGITNNDKTDNARQSANNTVLVEGGQLDSVETSLKTETLTGIQAAMAKHMADALSTIPHFSVSDELAMNNLIALRKKLQLQFDEQGIKLSFMPFFIKALSLAINAFPLLNSRLNDNATEVTYLAEHNIGIAMDSPIGLVVPNIKNVEQKSLYDIALELQHLISLSKERRLTSKELTGGTITISNIGALGGITATPVINKPEVAIVALGKTQVLPRFNQHGDVEKHNIMTVNWSGDHRIIDGATMVRFNNLWCSFLANPETMLMHLS